MATVRISKKVVMSHLDPDGGRLLAGQYAKRLERVLADAKAKELPGSFFSLTVDASRYADVTDEDRFRRIDEMARRDQWLGRFMTRVGKECGRSLKGDWVGKIEYQRSGLIHFHVIAIGLPYIPQKRLAELWGHGWLSVKKCRERHASYIAKYQSKVGGYPAFLYERETVRIWCTSPGFWTKYGAIRPRLVLPDAEGEAIAGGAATGVQRRGGGAIGERLAESRGKLLIRDEFGNKASVKGDFGTSCISMVQRRFKRLGTRWGGVEYESASLNDVVAAVEWGERQAEAISTANELIPFGAAARAACGPAAAVDLFIPQKVTPQQKERVWTTRVLMADVCSQYESIMRVLVDGWPDDVAPF